MYQPKYRLIANLGDATPLINGGYFVYVDKTGVYPPMAEYVECLPYETYPDSPAARWIVYRFDLEPCTYVNGVLSDNPFHPDHAAWFADSIESIAASVDYPPDQLRDDLCSADPIRLAMAREAIGMYHGLENLDEEPLHLTRAEINERYPEFAV